MGKAIKMVLLVAVSSFLMNISSGREAGQKPIVKQPFLWRYHSLEYAYLPSFFKVWSKYTVPLPTDSLVNDYYAKVLAHYNDDEYPDSIFPDHKYEVLPYCVKVTYIEKAFGAGRDFKNEILGDYPELFRNRGESSYVVPKVNLDKPVLYLTPEINGLLDDYLGAGVPEKGYYPDRIEALSRFIQLNRGSWPGLYSYCTLPVIDEMIFYTDGVVIEITHKNVFETFFLPDGSFEEVVSLFFGIS